MELKHLHIFLNVCETGSFTAAGKAMNYAQSTISESIQALEADLNAPLFERLGRKIYMTAEGERLLPLARQMVQLEREVIGLFEEGAPKTLSVGITETLCVYKFPAFFRTFLDQNKELTIDFKIARCEEIPDLIRSNVIDVGFTIDNPIQYKDIETKQLFEEEIVFVHGLERVDSIPSFDKLTHKPIIISKGVTGYNQLFYEICETEGLSLGKIIYIDNIEGTKSYVKAGFGFAFIPKATVEQELNSGQFVCVNPNGKKYFQQVQILTHKDKVMTAHLKALIEAAEAVYGLGRITS